MTRLQIKIKDADKAVIVLNLLKELPFVEIEKNEEDNVGKSTGDRTEDLADLFGIWEGRKISLSDIRRKAWTRN